jgi:arylsulfatase A-like enzyme
MIAVDSARANAVDQFRLPSYCPSPVMLRYLIAFVALTVFKIGNDQSEVAAADHPNIVLIMVDDMGYGDPQCYNPDSKILTPSIDSLTRDGMRFTDAHAPGPLCHMSRYGLLTGRYPFRTDVKRWPKHALIEPGQTTIASLLKNVGYRTAMVGKWHLGFNEDGYDKPLPGGPVDCGFDSYFGIRASTDIPPYFYIAGDRAVSPPTDQIQANSSEGWSPIQGEFWRAGGIAPGLELKDVLPRFTDEAIKVIDSHAEAKAENPLFLYLAYPAPHTPWLPSQDFRGKSGAGMYGDFAMMVDSMIGRVLLALDESGMSKDTLVIFTSDNGPVWFEEDVERFRHDSSGGLRGMKADAWECGHRMPFIARWPGKVAAGSVSDQLICFTDMLATFAAVADAELPDGAGPDSFSILPALLGDQKTSVRPSVAMQAGSGVMMVRKGPWKLITALGSGGFSEPKRIRPGKGDPPGQLYNLAEDLGETKNLYLQKPAVVEELTRELKRIEQGG